MPLSNVMIRDGNKMIFVNIEIRRVVDVRMPKAMVPPKEEKAKIIKPENSTIDVYTILLPTSMIVLLTAIGTKNFCV